MMVKIFIQRKVKAGKEEDFKKIVRELFTGAIHARGFVSGETLKSIEKPAIHLTIGTWKNLSDWDNWINSPARKKVQEKLDQVLAEPATMIPFQYE
jgi:heme oxygenase (mycobilin-producing)